MRSQAPIAKEVMNQIKQLETLLKRTSLREQRKQAEKKLTELKANFL